MQFFRMKQQFYWNKNETINTNDTLKLEFMTPKIMHRDTNANGSQQWNILKCNILHDCLNPSWVCWVDTGKSKWRVMSGDKNRCVLVAIHHHLPFPVSTRTDVLFVSFPQGTDIWPALCLGSWLCWELFLFKSQRGREEETIERERRLTEPVHR